MVGKIATLAVVVGCATTGSPVAPPTAWNWHTLRAEHRVFVRRTGDAYKLRGLFLARRDDGRFRVRALGPADITLFDVVGDANGCRVIEAARAPNESTVRGLCEDLRSAYHLPGAKSEAVEVLYDDWRTVGGHLVAWKIRMRDKARQWDVLIETVSVDVDISVDDAALPAP